MPRIARLAALLALQALLICPAALAREVIVIGVRDDVPPFVSRNARDNTYVGFLWDLCIAAVTRAGYHFVTEQLDADGRTQFLDLGSKTIDLLCDPTTITLDRIYHTVPSLKKEAREKSTKDITEKSLVESLSFSPIIFIANGTYFEPGEKLRGRRAPKPPEEPPKEPVTPNWLGETFRMLLYAPGDSKAADGAPPVREEVWGFVRGATIEAVLQQELPETMLRQDVKVRSEEFDSHQLAAAAFCEGKLDRYYGDAEIVRAMIARQAEKAAGGAAPKTGSDAPSSSGQAANQKNQQEKAAEAAEKPADTICDSQAAKGAASYEPYALIMSSHNHAEFPRQMNWAIYSMFADRTVERIYRAHFPSEASSPLLTMLFRINTIPDRCQIPGFQAAACGKTQTPASGTALTRNEQP